MKILRRNDNSNNRGNVNHSEELSHLKAIPLMEELERTRRSKDEDMRDAPSSERQHPFDPKRLLCFSGKSKKYKAEDYEFGDANMKKSPWRSEKSKSTTKYNGKGQDLVTSNRRRKNGDIADICNELCRDYYEIRKKLRNRPIVLTNKRIQVLDSTSGSNSTTSSFDAPLRKFHDDDKQKKKYPRGIKSLHFSNENRELHRRQPSLLDDNGSVINQKKKSKSNNQSTQKQPKSISINSWRSDGNKNISHKSKSNKQNNKNSKNKKSSSFKSSRSKSNVGWEDSPEMKGSESTTYTLPVSYVERKNHRNNVQPDLSMISTLTSSSYTTYDESNVILSPRGANDKVERHSIPTNEIVDSNLGLVCAPMTYASPQQQSRSHASRNPSVVGMTLTSLGTITEGDAYASLSVSSSASFSSYSSSSSSGESGHYYTESDSDGEEYDPSIVYGHDFAVKAIKATSKIRSKKNNANGGCNIAGGEMWKMFEEGSNSIVASDGFRHDDRRGDYYR